MSAIGSLVFCNDCGNLLEVNTGRKAYITCNVCGTSNKDTSSKTIVTTSKPSAFPSTLRTRLRTDIQEISDEGVQVEMQTDERCDKCGRDDVRYHVQQLRSADEGTTVFYTCQNCGNKWNLNN